MANESSCKARLLAAPAPSAAFFNIAHQTLSALYAGVLVIVILPLLATPLKSYAESPPDDTVPAESQSHSQNDIASPASGLDVDGTIAILKDQDVSIDTTHLHPLTDSPGNVYVITDEDIRHSGAIDLPTVLRRIPGLDVMQVTAADFNVSMRGDNQLQQNKLLLLVDGRSIYEDIQGQVWWKSIPVTLPEIKRIEILKGPASVLYGFNAFDGVINIITKSPEEMRGATLQFGGGEYGTISAAAVQAGKIDQWGYRLSLGHDQTGQWNNRDALGFRSNKFHGQVEYGFHDGSKLTASGGLVDTNRFDGPVFDLVHGATKITNGHANLLYERPNFFIRTWWQSWNDNFSPLVDPRIASFIVLSDPNGNRTLTARQDSYNIEAQHALEFGPTNRLTYGFNYRHNTGESTALSQFTREDRFGVYVQDEWRLTKSLTAVGGIRFDLDSFINPTYSPRGALVYKVSEDHSLRLSGSVAYRPPTMFETNGNSSSSVFFPGIPPVVPPAVIPGQLQGSDNLAPEKITAIELGYQGWFFKHRLRLRTDLFFNHISDLIARTRPPDNPRLVTFLNNGTADIHGLEVGVEFQATPWLTGFLNYTYQQIGQTFTIAEVRRGAPRDKINAGLRGEWTNGLSAEAAVHYVSSASYPVSGAFSQFAVFPFNGPPAPDTVVGSYTLLNLRAAYQFWNERAEFAVSAFNSLNDKHKEHPLGDVIGSRVLGWLTLKY